VIDQVTQDCRKRFSGDARCEFLTCGLEEFKPSDKFDVVVMTELLYYLPVESTEPLFRKAQSFLRNASSIVIISMGGKANVGIRKIWRRLDALADALQTISFIDPESGNIKTLKIYGASRESEASERNAALAAVIGFGARG
jgi:cyclopropane fatty-acyl-phospholipid synthase-like methyltransferase